METFRSCISAENCFMKKILLPLVLLIVGKAANAQSENKQPPPPPPPNKEVVKFNPPVIVKDKDIQEQPVVTVSGKMADEFYKKNASVSEILRQGNIITIKKKDGKTEKYDLSSKEGSRIFGEKYGESPIPPPPPPKVNLTRFKPPVIIAKGEKADDFYKRNPSVLEISRQGNIIILKMKDGTKEEYNVDRKDEMKSLTDKYGECPLPPPPPPPKKVSSLRQ